MSRWLPVGLDFAPLSSGVVSGTGAKSLSYDLVRNPPNPDGVRKSWAERLVAARGVKKSIASRLDGADQLPFIAIEDFSYGRWEGTSYIEIAESRGMMLALFEISGWPFILVHPGRVRHFAEKAKDKGAVIKFVEEYIDMCALPPLPEENCNKREKTDLADAFVLWCIAVRFLVAPAKLPRSWILGEASFNEARLSSLEPYYRGLKEQG